FSPLSRTERTSFATGTGRLRIGAGSLGFGGSGSRMTIRGSLRPARRMDLEFEAAQESMSLVAAFLSRRAAAYDHSQADAETHAPQDGPNDSGTASFGEWPPTASSHRQ